MEDLLFAAISALWLGMLTSISPCPLATNIAAISYIGKGLSRTGEVLLAGLFYSLGRMIVYLALGIIIVSSIMSVSTLSIFLQEYMNKILGPILIVTGMFLLELIKINLPGTGFSAKARAIADKGGIFGALPLGIIFALSICPVSAALFFGSLIPLSLKLNSDILLPSVYGIGTALPVLAFAIIISVSTSMLGKIFDQITRIELWARRITGIIFILIGIYYTVEFIFKFQL